MQFTVTREYRFAATHRLPQLLTPHVCSRRPHTHDYVVRVSLSARDIDSDGFVRDNCQQVIDATRALDGAPLHEWIEPEYTTAECLAAILFAVFRKFYSEVCKVSVSEVRGCWVEFDGPMPPQWARQQATALMAHLHVASATPHIEGAKNGLTMP